MKQFIQYSGWPPKVDEQYFLKVKHLPSLIIYLKRNRLLKSQALVCVLFVKAPYRLQILSLLLSSPPLHLFLSCELTLHLSLFLFASLLSSSALDGTCIWEGIVGIPDMPVVWMDIFIQVPTFRPGYSGRLWPPDGCCVVWVFLSSWVCLSVCSWSGIIWCALRAQSVGVNIRPQLCSHSVQ